MSFLDSNAGIKCSICGHEVAAKTIDRCNAKMIPHDLWAAITPWHRRLTKLWKETIGKEWK